MSAPSLDAVRASLGLESLTAAFNLSPEELSAKAKAQARDDEGKFVEEADVKATLPEAEEATPPPPESETIPAEDLLPGDVIEHDGAPHTVDSVEVQSGTARVSGRPTATPDEPTRLLGEWDADEYVALTSEAPVEPEPEWLTRYREVRSRLPEDMTLFGRDTTENPLLPRVRETLAEQRRVRDLYASGDRSDDALRDTRTALHLSPDDAIPDDAVDRMDIAIDSLASLEQSMSGSRGVVDVDATADGKPTPGPVVQEHLDTLLELGMILNDELERRIQAAVPARTRSAAEAQAELDDARDRLNDYVTEHEEKVRAKREEVLAAEWPSIVAENPRRRAFGSADEVVGIATGLFRSTPARTAVAADLFQKMEAAVAADPELANHQQVLSDFYAEINRLDDEAGQARRAEHFGDPRGLHGSEAYGTAQREQAIALISELREVGGKARMTMRVPDRDKEAVRDSLRTTFESFPTEWLDDLEAQNIRIIMGRRGRYERDGGEDGRPHVTFSNDQRSRSPLPGFSKVATHELGHGVEESRSHIKTAEWAFSHRRSPRSESETERVPGHRVNELAHRDEWASMYTGKVYGDSHLAPWEILTMGLESLLTHSPHFFRTLEQGGFDAEFRAFILALLAEA